MLLEWPIDLDIDFTISGTTDEVPPPNLAILQEVTFEPVVREIVFTDVSREATFTGETDMANQDPFICSSPGKLIGQKFFVRPVKDGDTIDDASIEITCDQAASVTFENITVNAETLYNEQGKAFGPGTVIVFDLIVVAGIDPEDENDFEQTTILCSFETVSGEILTLEHYLKIENILAE